MLTGPSPTGCEKPGAQRDAAPSPGDRHPLLGPPGSRSAPARCKAWPLHRGPPIPRSGFPTHGDSRPPPARCPPPTQEPRCPFAQRDRVGLVEGRRESHLQLRSARPPDARPHPPIQESGWGRPLPPGPLRRVRELSSRHRERGQAPGCGPPRPDGKASRDVRPSHVPLSQVTMGKASKAPGDKTAGLKGPRGTCCSAGIGARQSCPKAQGAPAKQSAAPWGGRARRDPRQDPQGDTHHRPPQMTGLLHPREQ